MRTDKEITADVVEALMWESSITSKDVHATAHDGVVTLTGFVPTYAERHTAEQVVRHVSGVKAVAEELKVNFSGAVMRSDPDIAKAVVDALRWHVWIPDTVQATVQDGWVTLTGEVSAEYQRASARHAISHLAGVAGVSNNITIAASVKPVAVKEAIERALSRDAEIDANTVKVTTQGSHVTLAGKIRTWDERERAGTAAWNAPGVTAVDNNLVVTF